MFSGTLGIRTLQEDFYISTNFLKFILIEDFFNNNSNNNNNVHEGLIALHEKT